MKPNNSLTTKQRKFADHYLLDPKRRANRAYDAACGRGPEMSANAARVGGCRMLKNPKIAAYIQRREDEVAGKLQEKYEISEERIIGELAAIGFSALTDYAEWDKETITLKNSEDLSPEQAAAIHEVAHLKDGIRLKTHSKLRALELLGKWKRLRLWVDRTEHGTNDPLKDLMDAIAAKRDIEPPRVTIEEGYQAPRMLPELG